MITKKNSNARAQGHEHGHFFIRVLLNPSMAKIYMLPGNAKSEMRRTFFLNNNFAV
jgi:hypothetical protein